MEEKKMNNPSEDVQKMNVTDTITIQTPEPQEREKIKVTDIDIIVDPVLVDGKPYCEIKYKEVGENDYHLGFGSFSLENVMKWRREEFELVFEPVEPAEDAVKDPSHYQHGTFEVIDEMVIMFGMEKTIAFCQLNAWKYRARAPYKNNFDEDMAKADRYLEMAYELQQIRQEYPEADRYEVCALLKGRKEGAI